MKIIDSINYVYNNDLRNSFAFCYRANSSLQTYMLRALAFDVVRFGVFDRTTSFSKKNSEMT